MIVLVQNDTKPDLLLKLRSGGGPVNLTGASVTLSIRKPSGAVLSKSAAISGSATAGTVTVGWGDGDLDEVGPHTADVVVDFGAGAVQTSKYAIEMYVREKFQEQI
jgi:hypothetical protein